MTNSILKSVTILVAGTILSSGISLSSAISASANQQLTATEDANLSMHIASRPTKEVHVAKTEAVKDEAQKRIDYQELVRLQANFIDAVREHGSASWPAFVKGRYLLQWYIEQNELEDAAPLCEMLVQYCRDSIANDSGSSTVSGAFEKERLSSAKHDHNNLILCLTVLAELNNRSGQSEKSAELMDDARKTYDHYQFRNVDSRAQSFEQFIEINSVPNAATQTKLSSLLNWREY